MKRDKIARGECRVLIYYQVGDRYKDMGLICVLYDYLPASSEQQGSFGTNRHGF